MFGPLLVVYKGFLVIYFVLDKKIYNSKQNPKMSFYKKNFLLNVNLKNVVMQKRCTRAILVGAEKIQIRKNQNLIHIEKIA